MFRKLKVFFVIAFVIGIISLIFLLFYSTQTYAGRWSVTTQTGLKYFTILKTKYKDEESRRIFGNKIPEDLTNLMKKGGNANLGKEDHLSPFTQRTSLSTINNNNNAAIQVFTTPVSKKEESSSKSPNGGDKVDQLIEQNLEKSKPRLHSEGDQPVDSTSDSLPPTDPNTEPEPEIVQNSTPLSASKPPPDEEDEDLELCPAKPKTLTGPLYVNQIVPKMEELEKHLSEAYGGWVQKGGAWRPSQCKARVKMALIVPFRKRYEQLGIFVRHMHPMLKRQELDYRIIIVEQSGDTPFNRAILFNIGYKEALKFKNFDCFIFHDVDLIPEDDRNMYSCPTSPRHMSVAVDKFNYQLPYATIFGGAGAFKKKDFEEVNGFSNKFWGWGGEDDDLYQRVVAKGHHLTRPSLQIGRYKMIRLHHHQSSKADPNRFALLGDSATRMATDGLNSLNYKLLAVKEQPLYTLVTIHTDKSMLPS